jgi:branched-chain amino acid transport system substrate-binding protein
MKLLRRIAAIVTLPLIAFLGGLASCSEAQQDPVRIATIQPLTGPFALQGEELVKQFSAAAELLNAQGGIYDGRKIEIVPLDGKATVQDSLLALRQAADMNISFVNSNISSVVHALSDGVLKHNRRNPDKQTDSVDQHGCSRSGFD